MNIKYLDFSMPPFLRLKWVNQQAKIVWEQRIEHIKNSLFRTRYLESESQAACQLLAIPENEFTTTIDLLTKTYSAFEILLGPGDAVSLKGLPFTMNKGDYLIVLGALVQLDLFKENWYAEETEAMLNQLNSASCCDSYFSSSSVVSQKQDFPLQSYNNNNFCESGVGAQCHSLQSSTTTNSDTLSFSEKSFLMNVFWQPLGLSLLDYFPCSSRCTESMELANQLFDKFTMSHPQEAEWLQEILSWPLEWSTLHGIAEVKTPIVTFCYNATAMGNKVTIELHTSEYPVEGGHGVCFPYKIHHKNIQTPIDPLEIVPSQGVLS